MIPVIFVCFSSNPGVPFVITGISKFCMLFCGKNMVFQKILDGIEQDFKNFMEGKHVLNQKPFNLKMRAEISISNEL